MPRPAIYIPRMFMFSKQFFDGGQFSSSIKPHGPGTGQRKSWWHDFVCWGACHYLAPMHLYVAKQRWPQYDWRIVRSDTHSTIWDGQERIFELNWRAYNDLSASEVLATSTEAHSKYELSDLSFSLDIKTSMPSEPIGNMLNEMVPSDASILAISIPTPSVMDGSEYRNMTETELHEILFTTPSIRITTATPSVKTFTADAPNGKWFSVADTLGAIADVETKVRPLMTWFGGVDCHHVYFEGEGDREKGDILLHWGS